jgi:hypothetical protein
LEFAEIAAALATAIASAELLDERPQRSKVTLRRLPVERIVARPRDTTARPSGWPAAARRSSSGAAAGSSSPAMRRAGTAAIAAPGRAEPSRRAADHPLIWPVMARSDSPTMAR